MTESTIRPLKRTRVAGESSLNTAQLVAHSETTNLSTQTSNSSNAHTKSMLVAVPLDIIHEIFGYLDSIDLLNLARTNKQLRDFLMSRKKTKAMWRVARQNLNIEGLPDCPIYMSEPAYANITFGHYCHKCLRLGLHEVVWEFSARYCAECLKSHEVTWPEMYTDIYFTRVLGDRSQFKWTHYLVCYSPDGTRKLYPCSAREKLVREITERTEDEDAMDAYLVDTRDLVETIQSQAREYHDWYKSTLSKRLQNIVAKLREEGWGADLNKMSEEDFAPLRSYPNVTILKPLTNDEWHDIRGHIIAGLEQYREARIRRERPAILRARLSDLRRVVCELQLGTRGYRTPETEYGPQFADIALMPEFRALVEASIDVEIKRSTFRGVCSQLPALFARFNTNRPAILAGMFSQRIGRPTSPTGCTKILDLAIAWFHCDGCKRYLHSPGVFAHQCQRPHYRDTEREEFDDPYVYDVAVASTFHAWSTTKLRPVLEEDLGALRSLIASCGLDPDRATAKDMDAHDARVTCNEIPVPWARKSEGRLVMTWRRAVLSLDMVRGCQTVNWRCIRAADKRRAVLLEERALQAGRKQPEYKSFLQCALCDEPWWLVHGSHSNSFLMSDHLRTKHGVQVEILYSIRNYMYTHPDGTPETPEVWLPFL